jgi:hypothetical protein
VKAESLMIVYASCPNIQYLRLIDHDIADVTLDSLNHGLKKKLKRLASLKMDDVPFRLDTDWVGY